MPIGPGKYDAPLTVARQAVGATAAVLIVLDGKHGAGFSVQAPADVIFALPALLRMIADDIEASRE